MLDKQIHMYAVNTGHFYSNHEKYLQEGYYRCRSERKYLERRLQEVKKRTQHQKNTEKSKREIVRLEELIRYKGSRAKEYKERLTTLLSHKTIQNQLTNGRDHIRSIRDGSLNCAQVISVFDSFLTRTIGIGQNELTKTLIVVQVYYFDVFQDLLFYGFLYGGHRYSYLTSSAGQIRSKKAVFIRTDIWEQIHPTILCGLTLEKINARGGSNANKYLAYLALSNSATEEWTDFNIDKTIVIEDFETLVYGTFDFVDERDYSITRKTDFVPLTHTDGAGMMLPCVSAKNFMIRAPWIKGLLGVFDFRKFLQVHHCSPVITDIYGELHDIIQEDIQIIFTKSQFKMYSYYDSWTEYKEAFKKYRCSAGRCNMEEERIRNAKLNYQMLQTLTHITEEEVDLITSQSAQRIRNICTSPETMLETLGVTPYNTHPTPFQKALKLFPALLNDIYTKDMLRKVKNSLLKKYRSGKLEINGKYTFLLPDYYAACEYWFSHIQNPQGLLADQEVFCWLFRRQDRLDCLRSPHLYKEHAIRTNVAGTTDVQRIQQLREWFPTNALYTSSHDLISKMLQFDVDGDKSLVVADKDFIQIAQRNMEDIVPLYYNMRKSPSVQLNPTTIYAGLHKAFTSGNIGLYSNDISKIWNHEVFIQGTAEEKKEALKVISLLCMENNFCIDAAKTLYMPTRADWFAPLVSKYTKTKLPAFFTFAKDKETAQVAPRNHSLVNQIFDKIPDQPIRTRGLQMEQLRFQLLMHNPKLICSREVADCYNKLNRKYHYLIYQKEEQADNLGYILTTIRETFAIFGQESHIADMLVEYLYGRKKRYKQLLWLCYGQYLADNLEKNLGVKKSKYIQCTDCLEWLEIESSSRTKRCAACSAAFQKEKTRLRVQKYRRQKQENQISKLSSTEGGIEK